MVTFQVIRLESQVARYRSAAENAEKIEDELKAEKRKLQREVKFLGPASTPLETERFTFLKRSAQVTHLEKTASARHAAACWSAVSVHK